MDLGCVASKTKIFVHQENFDKFMSQLFPSLQRCQLLVSAGRKLATFIDVSVFENVSSRYFVFLVAFP